MWKTGSYIYTIKAGVILKFIGLVLVGYCWAIMPSKFIKMQSYAMKIKESIHNQGQHDIIYIYIIFWMFSFILYKYLNIIWNQEINARLDSLVAMKL